VHFCEEVLSGKLCCNQLVIKDGKLTEKADAKVDAVDDTLKPVMLTSHSPKVVLSSQTPQTKPVRPPTLVSVGTQVYPSLLNNATSVLVKGSQHKADVGGLGLQTDGKQRSDKSKLSHFVSEKVADVAASREQSQNDANKPTKQSQRSQRKPVIVVDAAETCPSTKKPVVYEVVSQITKASSIRVAADDRESGADKNNMALETVKFGNLEEANNKAVYPKSGAEDLGTSGGKFQCSVCGFSTNNVRKISEHNRAHQRANNICYYCEQRFDSSTELSVHVDTDHSDIQTNSMPFACSSCPARFRTRTQLVSHLPKHSSTRPYICAKCGASFKWRSTLHDHAATHTSRKEHLCDICGYATAHRSQLRSHRLVHTGGTMHCSWPGCDYLATRLQSLKYHLLTHTQEKPHQCDICGQSFSLSRNLKRHMLSHVQTATKHK